MWGAGVSRVLVTQQFVLRIIMSNLRWNFEPVLSKHHAVCILHYKTHVGKQDSILGSVNGGSQGLRATGALL